MIFASIEAIGIGIGLFFVFCVVALLVGSVKTPRHNGASIAQGHAPFGWKWDNKIKTWAQCGPDGEIDEL